MLKKAREKAKEGLRSVNAETKRYIQTKARHSQYGGGRGRPRQAPPSSRSAAVSFKGFSDNFEAILNDDFDFTNQFESGDEEESSSVGAEGHHQPSSSIGVGEEGWSEEKAFADDSDLFSDPIFSETEHDPLKSRLPVTNDVDPLLVTDAPQATSLLHDSDSHLDNKSPSVKTDTLPSPESDDTHLLESRDSVSVLKEHTSETHLPEEAGDTEEALPPDSPLFNDDVEHSACPKEGDVGSRSGMNIFVTQPSDETHPDQPSHNESEDWLFGERSNQRLEGDKTADLPKSNTPDLPDIDELERNLAVNKLGGVQDLFSSEESPFSSLASSYEGEKAEVLPHISSTTFPSTEGASQIEADHSENELFTSHGGKEESSGLTGDTGPSGGEQDKLTIDKELEALLTPKKKPKMSDSIPVLSTIHPAVDDPLLSPSQQEEARTERARSQLDSGVFEQSSNSVVMKRTPEREGVTGDDLFQIDEDHFKNDDSTPVLTKRPLTKGSSNIEVSQSKKGLFNTFSAPNISPPSDSTSSSPPQKKPPGKTGPPPRPAISPKLKHRMIQKQQSGSGGAEVLHQDGIVAKKKIIQPLGHAPQRSEIADHSPTAQPESLDSSLSSEAATAPVKVSHTDPTLTPVSTKSDDRRIPADDLFLEDNLVSPSSSDKPTINVGDSGEPSENAVLEQGVTKSETMAAQEDDETDYSFLYHLLFAYCLYFYYSLNIFPYLSGFFAGFFVLYLTVGSVFIFYVQTVEKYQSGGGAEDKQQEPSRDFTEHMHVDFDNLCVYKSKRFTATLTYDPATHHPSQRMKAVVHLVDNFELYVRVTSENSHAHTFGLLIDDKTDIRDCTITLVPDEVAKNRKRRWSKKFPIMIFKPPPNTYRVYLFLPHARVKEDWYRRLKHANNGWTSEQLIKKEKKFFAYMENYFPPHSFPRLASVSSRSTSKKSSRHGSSPRKSSVPKVRYSVNQENDDVSKEEVHESVSFKGSPKLQPAQSSSHSATRSYGESSHTDHHLSHTRSVSSSVDSEFEVIPRPLKLTKSSQLQWLNAMAARLCWDIWHEQRWKDWVTTRIQKKLIRVKTPSFMEQLRLTSVDLGNDMPVVEQLREGPKLDLRGIWVYLDVTYSGNFVMTIETKMKLGKENQAEEREGQQMSTMTKNRESGLPQSAPHRSSGQHHSTRRGLSHQHAAKALGGLDDSFEQEIDSGSDDEESATGLVVNPLEEDAATHSQDHSAHLSGGKRDKIKSMVSRITKKVTSAKIVQKAAQKVSSYPLVLTVVVKGLDGVLAVNIPPPPTDTIWYGFKNPPKLTLVAKPKLGNREVKLSRVSHWIERKLQELVNKKLVLPEMEDLVIPILNSGIPEDKLKPISSDTTPSAT